MNHLVASTKGREGKIYKVLSGKVFDLPTDLDNPKIYNSDYKLEDDEWFHIPNFSNEDYCLDFLKRQFISTDYDQIGTIDINNLLFLCSYQTGIYYFQKITPSLIVNKKWFKIGEPVIENQSPIIVINEIPDAVYVKSEDTLYFKDISSLTSIFKGIIELYKEATQLETEEFLRSEFIKLGEGYDALKVKTANRKRIALAMETIKGFSTREKSTIYSYIKDYCSEKLSFDEEESKFKINNEDELKHLLWGIEQRYYTTPVGNEKMVANSVSKV
ncbi:hypothetical protein [Gracilibacillus thailandensis]|uniref:ATP F0F1 synthase synthase n=1 Tax=Gracilibacillus thailandensis TaxID=563735 RepID=A0A6N7QX85_9BACI|nr:hypothetical protein [Gracilibacillus thailandensis]MRI66618.1 hypothetical protein [Gracilibacillus thailandensis]